MRMVAADPEAQVTRARAELAPGVRSLHLQYSGAKLPNGNLKRPVHILYYREVTPELIEIVRVLPERIDARRHFRKSSEN